MRRLLPFLLTLALLPLLAASAPAEENVSIVVKTKYFSVLGPPGLDVFALLHRINYDYFLQPDTLLAHKTDDPKEILSITTDAIMQEVSRILGINAYSFQATLEFLPDQDTVKVVVQGLTGVHVDEPGFYLHESKTIYISLKDITAGMLGHEMAHALVSHYFGAPPAANIQEILCGYVDFSLSKNIRNTVK